MKKPIHHFLPHLLAGLGAAFIVFIITLTFDVSHSPTGRADNIPTPPGCSFAAANYDNDLFVSTYDRAQYITYANQCDTTGQNCSKAILRTSATVREPVQDDACMISWMSYEQSLGNSLAITSPVVSGTEQRLSGITTFKMQSNLFSNTAITLNGVQFYSELQSGGPIGAPANYSRTILGTSIRHSMSDPRVIEVDIDTLAFYSATYRFTFCPITNSPNADHDFCSTVFTTPYTIANYGGGGLSFSNLSVLPQNLQFKVNNAQPVYQYNADVYAGTAVAGTPIQRYHWPFVAGQVNILSQIIPPPSADGNYTVRVYYTPLWGNIYPAGMMPPVFQDFFFNLQHSLPPPPGDSNSNTNATSAPTNTNTVTTMNTNTAPAAATSNSNTSTTIALSTIALPAERSSAFFLPQINGYVTSGQQVDLTLKNATSATEATTVWQKRFTVNTNKTFSYVLPEPLGPGSYILISRAVVDANLGPISTRTFSILPPTITLQPPQATTTTNLRTVTMTVHGQSSQIQLFAALGSLPPIYIGQAQPITGNTEQWSISFDITTLQPGTYAVYAVGTGVGNAQFRSTNGLNLEVKATTAPKTNSSEVPATTTVITTTPPTTPATSEPPATTPNVVVTTPTTSADAPKVSPSTDPRYDGVVKEEKLKVHQPSNSSSSTPTKPALTFSGVGPANTIVTLFIYSDPFVVTTRTDANGNWSYTLDQNIGDGQHQVFVTLTDSTGKVAEKSSPLSFFVNEAKAVSQQDFVAAQTPNDTAGNTYTTIYIIMAALIVLIAICAILFFRFGRTGRPHYA